MPRAATPLPVTSDSRPSTARAQDVDRPLSVSSSGSSGAPGCTAVGRGGQHHDAGHGRHGGARGGLPPPAAPQGQQQEQDGDLDQGGAHRRRREHGCRGDHQHDGLRAGGDEQPQGQPEDGEGGELERVLEGARGAQPAAGGRAHLGAELVAPREDQRGRPGGLLRPREGGLQRQHHGHDADQMTERGARREQDADQQQRQDLDQQPGAEQPADAVPAGGVEEVEADEHAERGQRQPERVQVAKDGRPLQDEQQEQGDEQDDVGVLEHTDRRGHPQPQLRGGGEDQHRAPRRQPRAAVQQQRPGGDRGRAQQHAQGEQVPVPGNQDEQRGGDRDGAQPRQQGGAHHLGGRRIDWLRGCRYTADAAVPAVSGRPRSPVEQQGHRVTTTASAAQAGGSRATASATVRRRVPSETTSTTAATWLRAPPGCSATPIGSGPATTRAASTGSLLRARIQSTNCWAGFSAVSSSGMITTSPSGRSSSSRRTSRAASALPAASANGTAGRWVSRWASRACRISGLTNLMVSTSRVPAASPTTAKVAMVRSGVGVSSASLVASGTSGCTLRVSTWARCCSTTRNSPGATSESPAAADSTRSSSASTIAAATASAVRVASAASPAVAVMDTACDTDCGIAVTAPPRSAPLRPSSSCWAARSSTSLEWASVAASATSCGVTGVLWPVSR